MSGSKTTLRLFAVFVTVLDIGYSIAFAYYRGAGDFTVTGILIPQLVVTTMFVVYSWIAVAATWDEN